MTRNDDPVGDWEERIESLLVAAGWTFDREDPGFFPGGLRWYVDVPDGNGADHRMIVSVEDGRAAAGNASFSVCRQAFLLGEDAALEDVFAVLARAALFENVGLVGAEDADGNRLLMVQRRVPLATLHRDEVVPMIEDVIAQFDRVLGNGPAARVDG